MDKRVQAVQNARASSPKMGIAFRSMRDRFFDPHLSVSSANNLKHSKKLFHFVLRWRYYRFTLFKNFLSLSLLCTFVIVASEWCCCWFDIHFPSSIHEMVFVALCYRNCNFIANRAALNKTFVRALWYTSVTCSSLLRLFHLQNDERYDIGIKKKDLKLQDAMLWTYKI